MRILLVVFNQVGKGTYWRALHFGRCLAARGHAVTLMATAPSAVWRIETSTVEGVQQLAMPDLLPGALRSGWDIVAVLRRLAWLRGRRFDIVHAFEARPVVIYPALAAQRAGAKLVMDWCDWLGRGGSVEERPSALMRAVLRPVETYFEEHFRTRADGTTVINRFLGERAAALGVARDTILLVRNGADASRPRMELPAARAASRLPEQLPIVGYVGGIYTRDAELMARAFRRIRQAKPEARLLLVGYFNRDIEGMLGSSDGVIRTGKVTAEAMATYLAAADVCWLPLCDSGANRGRWPLKLSDYMSAGRATVATAVGDLPEVIGQYGAGVVVSDNAEAIASATLVLLDDPPRRAALGQSARQAAERDLSWERLTDQVEALYSNIARGRFCL